MEENEKIYIDKSVASFYIYKFMNDHKSRGFTDPEYISQFENFSTDEIKKLLKSSNPQERTAAAFMLGERKIVDAAQALCETLVVEKKLYSKIAITEALGKIGEPAMPCLVKLLSRIGDNQYKEPPRKLFGKKNYPLPRDIAARTIIKIGEAALPYLEAVLNDGKAEVVSEAIDAIGYIAYYQKDKRSLPALKQCLDKFQGNKLIIWKIIRAFESFGDQFVIDYLNKAVNDPDLESILRSEAKRSLSKIKNK